MGELSSSAKFDVTVRRAKDLFSAVLPTYKAALEIRSIEHRVRMCVC